MKQYNKLFVILFAVLGVTTLKAQTDVTSQYLTNANFSSTEGWTQHVSGYRDIGSGNIGGKLGNYAASSTDATHLSSEYFFGFQCRWNGNYSSYNQVTSQALPSGVYTLSYDVENVNGSTSAVNYNNLFYVKVGDKTFTDTSVEWMKGNSSWTSHAITFVITEAAKATVSLGYGTGSNNLASGNTPVLYVSHLKLTYRELDDISSENPADLTSYIVNNSFENGNLDGWTVGGYSSDTGVKPNSNGTYATSGVDGNYLYNTWWQGTPLTQTVTNIPNGVYVLNVLVASGDGADKPKPNIFLTANGEHSTAYNISDGDNKVFHDVSYEFKVLNGQATIGVIGGNDAGEYVNGGHWWYKADNFRLTYKGADVSLLEDAFNANYTNLKNLSTDDVPTAFAQKISNLISTYETTPTSKKDLTTANAAIEAIISLHASIKTEYANLNGLITLCERYSNNSEPKGSAKSTFNEAINTAKTTAINAVEVKTLTDAFSVLESARQFYVLNAFPINGVTFDLTFKANTTWANSGNNYTAGGIVLKEKYAEQPWVGDVMSTSYTDLPNGTYDIEIYCNANACEWNFTSDITDGAKNSSVTANNVIVKVPVYKLKSNSTANVITLTDVVVKDHTMNIVVKNDLLGANWILANHKSLTLKAGLDVSEQQANVKELLAEANTLASKPMSSEVKTQLTTAINDADANSDNPDELETMITALQTAISTANASIAEYELIKTYIDKAKVFSAEIVTTYETGYNNGSFTDAETVRQGLNVAIANYVKENFKHEIQLTEWSAASNAMWTTKGEHWDGTNSTSYYDANGTNTTHTLSKTVELTSGTYIFRGAGRSSANTTLSLSIDISGIAPAVFTAKGNTGRGIDKEGNATFSDDAQYARNGQGQGWEWEFIKFTLEKNTTVTLTATCKTSGNGWASFANNGLWMDEDTYVKAQTNTLNTAKAQAQALVDTKPMGPAENNALEEAISQAEGTIDTPEKMNNALNALSTAIENANKWIENYCNEKGLLVAALERFERDFNDGVNGALHFTPVENWNNMINAVIAAAQAKDLLDNYSSFSQVAAELHAAMDAVYTSYVNYGMLVDHTSLIGNADCKSNDPSWPGDGRTTITGQHWSGDANRVYFAQNHEDGAARSQTIKLPKTGSYLLKVAVRTVEAASYAEILINGVSYKTTGAHGRTGGTIATDGSEWESIDTGIKAGKTFANGNKGFGWVYNYIYFKAEAGEATIAINLSNVNSGREANCGGMELYYLRPNYVVEENNVVRHYGIYDEAIATTHTTHDVTNATLTNKAIGVANNLNALIIAKSGQVSNQSNVIIGSTVASLALTDGYAFNAHDNFTATKLSYGRQLTKDTWLTICLPFDYTIPEGVKVETLTEIDTNTKIFTFDEITEGKMKANTPYIIKNSTNTAALFASLSSIGIEATPKVMKVSVNGVDAEFLGTYAPKNSTELMEGSTYDILFFGADGQLYYLSSGITTKEVTINPFRAYIRLPKNIINWNNGQQARVRHRSSEMTDIDTAESADDSQKTTVIYDMHGRRVTEIVKGGMYIVNGRKVVVK